MKKFMPACGFLLFLLATPKTASPVIIRGPVAAISTRSFRHRSTLYIPVASLARAFGLVLEEVDGPVFVFASDRCRLELIPGSPEARINGEAVRMDSPADWVDGKLAVPIYLAIQTLSSKFPPGEEEFEEIRPVSLPAGSVRIVLDPGHGGLDTGAVGAEGVEEKEVALGIAEKVKTLLEGRGHEVLMSRTGDGFVSLKKRARLANGNKADLFVSIHTNTAGNHLARGTEIFYYAPASDPRARELARRENAVLRLEGELNGSGAPPADGEGEGLEEKPAGRLLQSVQLARKVQKKMEAISDGPDRGVKAAKFYVLKYTEMPSILVETGFLSNRDERELLLDVGYREKMAEAIGEGICDYIESGFPRAAAGPGL